MSVTKFNCPNCGNKTDYKLPDVLIGDDCTEIECSECKATILVDIQLDVKLTYNPYDSGR